MPIFGSGASPFDGDVGESNSPFLCRQRSNMPLLIGLFREDHQREEHVRGLGPHHGPVRSRAVGQGRAQGLHEGHQEEAAAQRPPRGHAGHHGGQREKRDEIGA